ncbi:ABC transporter permease [Paenibacillus harenae]|uniref:NitT/TauT family transport system permease protein n=1 Tax=Paenibacillus harenae TaxID=306543 RepID=A0ABT9U481_PAEHA|nr:ABC transporter permease [Paenibacillus harenae]MDQ0114452.1 NitT/TauT family transport system permease protein [Paenibacillus harenae]
MKELAAVKSEPQAGMATMPAAGTVQEVDPRRVLEISKNEVSMRSQSRIYSGWKTLQPMLLPTGFAIVFLLVWQLDGFHRLFKLERYQLPIPSAIAASIKDNADLLWSYSLYTGTEILGGCLIGSLLGLAAAVVASMFPNAGKGAITLLASLNAVPIVALAPVMNNWFGDGVSSKIAIVSVMTMATMAISAFKGLRSIQPAYLDLMHTYAARRSTVFLKLRFRAAQPAIFTALKINMSTSIIGAIVGEFFISSKGLGFLLSDQIKLGNMPLAWSCIAIAAALGIILYYVVQLVERFIMPWHVSHRSPH